MFNESPIAWMVLSVTLGLLVALGVLVNINRWRFSRRVAAEMRALLASTDAEESRATDDSALPSPVLRYRALAISRRPPVQTLRLRHGGTFCMSETSKPLPIQGTQLFTASPPGFVWTGRIRICPGIWAHARDQSVKGQGGMRVLLDDTYSLVDLNGGPDLDQGAALRLLAEMVWYPTALFDSRYVSWSAVDDDHARATLRMQGVEVSGVFEFGKNGLPSRFHAKRVRDKGKLLPWGGIYRDYRDAAGMLVPFEAEVFWELPTGTFTYAHWLVDAMDFDERSSPVREHPEVKGKPSPVLAH